MKGLLARVLYNFLGAKHLKRNFFTAGNNVASYLTLARTNSAAGEQSMVAFVTRSQRFLVTLNLPFPLIGNQLFLSKGLFRNIKLPDIEFSVHRAGILPYVLKRVLNSAGNVRISVSRFMCDLFSGDCHG